MSIPDSLSRQIKDTLYAISALEDLFQQMLASSTCDVWEKQVIDGKERMLLVAFTEMPDLIVTELMEEKVTRLEATSVSQAETIEQLVLEIENLKI